MATLTLKGQEARDALIKGINELADVVTVTFGPKGQNVAVDKRWAPPNIIHDGVSVAKAIFPKDPFEAMGAELVKIAAEKTNDVAGDGTTTSILLAQAIINKGNEKIKKGANPMTIKKGIELAVSVLVDEIKSHAKTIKDKTEIAQIATISAADPDIGKLIAEALEKVGKEGVVTVEEGTSLKTEIHYKEGMEFDKGYESSAFITNSDRQVCEIENPYILFCDFSISNSDELATFLEKFISSTKSKNIVLITDGVEGSALTTLILNGKGHRGAINTVAVVAPGIGEKRKALLEDMAILTGGKAAYKENGILIDNIPIEALGRADKVEVSKDTTKIIGGKGDPDLLRQRIDTLKNLLKEEVSEFEQEKLQQRLAKLTGGAAVIEVGGTTEIEIHDKKERVIDAVSATKAAVEEGIVAGGGVTYLKVREALNPLIEGMPLGDKTTGIGLIYDALEKPIHLLMENGAIPKGQELPIDGKTGFNVETGKMVDMFEAGIIDPAKVTRQAIENAASVAAMILTTGSAITEIIEDKKSPLEQQPIVM